ncbi:MAG: hypothetical protein WAM91_13215 [Candidatus Acidiferrales bacterium]
MATKRRPSRKRKGSHRGSTLTDEQMRVFDELMGNVKKYSPMIRRKLRAAGVVPDEGLVFVTAMYFPALDRLAHDDDEDQVKSAPQK